MASAAWFGQALLGQFSSTANRRVDWDADTIKVGLYTAALTLDTTTQDTFNFRDDLSNEVSGNGYVAQNLTTDPPNYDATTNHVQLRAANTTFTATGAGWSHRYIVIYKSVGTAATDPLLGWVDTGGSTSVPAGNYVIDWDDTDGVLAITVL